MVSLIDKVWSPKNLAGSLQKVVAKGGSAGMKAICADLNLTLKGWFGYFQHSVAHVLESIDGYVRGRLRSILRRRMKRKGRAKGKDLPMAKYLLLRCDSPRCGTDSMIGATKISNTPLSRRVFSLP